MNMKILKTFLAFVLLLQIVYSQEKVIFPYGKQVSDEDKSKTESLQWNRYVSRNFTVLSIDDRQGEWLYKNLENMKSWSLTRWGFPDFDPTKEYRIFCVPLKKDLKKFFNLDEQRSEYRKDVAVIWLSLDEKPSKSVSPYLTHILIKDFADKYSLKIDFWFMMAISELNSHPDYFKNNFSQIQNLIQAGKPLYGLNYLLNMNYDKYLKESPERQNLFCTQSSILLLMLRKEFGQQKLINYIKISKDNDFESCLKKIYNYDSIGDFEKKYMKYMFDLTKNIKENKVPENYFDIKEVKK